ncbi:MAG: AAA family ATPase [Candidatus Rokubacteria bacterium]|nr:AAA family ATPase [Candidatus Rokubacteria bacterium]
MAVSIEAKYLADLAWPTYTSHFGLSEAPFAITPDPRYLYMSERHREALAHLLYGIGEGGGFVQLTGEVGTGKTTLCRALLERLPPHVDVALILNPRVTAPELLAAVCDELRIPYPAGTTSAKVLVDALYRYLLDAHAAGRRTVLLIDEAQNLATDVLEQIRLLTNLETAREKLLQIILIGQPELIELLERPELRQVAQRITARYHLLPFSEAATRACVRYRLKVAGQPAPIFTEAALREVHRCSRGVPRLVNVICDRALLGAYAGDELQVDVSVVRKAAAEVLGERVRAPRRGHILAWASAGALVLLLGAGVLVGPSRVAELPGRAHLALLGLRAPTPVATPANGLSAGSAGLETPPSAAAALPPGAGRRAGQPASAADLMEDQALPGDLATAFASLYSRWGIEAFPGRGPLGCEQAKTHGLRCLAGSGSWTRLRRLDLPAIIELVTPAGDRRYGTITALSADRVTLAFGGQDFALPLAAVEPFWGGRFTLLWRPPTLTTLTIAPGARGPDVEWLRRRLGEIDGQPLGDTNPAVYDDELRGRVVAFQRSRALVPDGVVGEDTLSQLVTAGAEATLPLLSARAGR